MTFSQEDMSWVLGEATELVVERLYVMISPGIPNLKRVAIRATDTEARKRGQSKELDTPVAHAANDADSPLDIPFSFCRNEELCVQRKKLTREVSRLRSTTARLKLKGIDGGPHKQWSMWFNSTIREQPYQVLLCIFVTIFIDGRDTRCTGAAWLSSVCVVRCWVKS